MKPRVSVKIDPDYSGSDTAKAKVTFQMMDAADYLGEAVDVLVYVPQRGLSFREISRAATEQARLILRRILSEEGT